LSKKVLIANVMGAEADRIFAMQTGDLTRLLLGLEYLPILSKFISISLAIQIWQSDWVK
jgi:hypothetical protein